MPIFSAYLFAIIDKKIPEFIMEFVDNLKFVINKIFFYIFKKLFIFIISQSKNIN